MSAGTMLTGATGFFFERDDRLFLVTSRHVVLDEASNHRPDRLEIELHVDPKNIAVVTQMSIPLYRDNQPVWRQGVDSGGSVDIVAVELAAGCAAADDSSVKLYSLSSRHRVRSDRSWNCRADRRVSIGLS